MSLCDKQRLSNLICEYITIHTWFALLFGEREEAWENTIYAENEFIFLLGNYCWPAYFMATNYQLELVYLCVISGWIEDIKRSSNA